jgi:hypothetical protein
MRLSVATTLAVLSLLSFLPPASGLAQARVEPFPPAFKSEMITTNGTKLYVRVGGKGPAVVLLHGYALWHFSFYGPDAERLVKGRERIYLDRFWNEFPADPKNFDEE